MVLAMEILCPNGAKAQIEEDFLSEDMEEENRRRRLAWEMASDILRRAQEEAQCEA